MSGEEGIEQPGYGAGITPLERVVMVSVYLAVIASCCGSSCSPARRRPRSSELVGPAHVPAREAAHAPPRASAHVRMPGGAACGPAGVRACADSP